MMENLIWNFRINKILSSKKIQLSPNERLGLKHNDRFWLNPNRSLDRLMYNYNNCLQSFVFYKAPFACF